MIPTLPRALLALPLAACLIAPVAAQAAEEVNVYTTREPGLAQPLFDRFSEETGIKVNTVFVEKGLAERVAAEGENSPADVLMVVDYGALIDLTTRGLTQETSSELLNATVPANLRDPAGHWYALSLRARLVYASKDRVTDTAITYESLADPKWKGKVCIRSGQHPYNTSLFAAYIAKHGAEAAGEYLQALKANLARKAGGGDRDGARDIAAGICDIAVGNSYYVGLMRSGRGGDEQKAWGDAIRVLMPTFDDGKGTHVNISGASVAKNSPNKAKAIKLLEFLVSDEAQRIYADANFEYPVKASVAPDPIIASFGELTVDPLPLSELSANREEASKLVDAVGFDN
jgi:iron(III) transport system substrate-binding protein